jgi:RNA polymerase sigma factor (sigma-70 family)
MGKQVEVELNFINKKGEEKHVKFWMDKQTFDALHDESVSEEIRHRYLVDEYHAIEQERYYKRKFVPFDCELAQSLELIEDTSISNEEKYDLDLNNEAIKEAIMKLSPRQKEIVKLLYWEGKSQKDLCKIYGLKKQSVSDAVKRIHIALRNILKK